MIEQDCSEKMDRMTPPHVLVLYSFLIKLQCMELVYAARKQGERSQALCLRLGKGGHESNTALKQCSVCWCTEPGDLQVLKGLLIPQGVSHLQNLAMRLEIQMLHQEEKHVSPSAARCLSPTSARAAESAALSMSTAAPWSCYGSK